MQSLTEKQQATLEFIRAYIREHGMAPTMNEIASGMGWRSANAAHSHVSALRRKGFISVRQGANRGLALCQRETLDVPDTADSKYWFEGIFQHQRYERDVYKVIEAAGLKGGKKSWGVRLKDASPKSDYLPGERYES